MESFRVFLEFFQLFLVNWSKLGGCRLSHVSVIEHKAGQRQGEWRAKLVGVEGRKRARDGEE